MTKNPDHMRINLENRINQLQQQISGAGLTKKQMLQCFPSIYQSTEMNLSGEVFLKLKKASEESDRFSGLLPFFVLERQFENLYRLLNDFDLSPEKYSSCILNCQEKNSLILKVEEGVVFAFCAEFLDLIMIISRIFSRYQEIQKTKDLRQDIQKFRVSGVLCDRDIPFSDIAAALSETTVLFRLACMTAAENDGKIRKIQLGELDLCEVRFNCFSEEQILAGAKLLISHCEKQSLDLSIAAGAVLISLLSEFIFYRKKVKAGKIAEMIELIRTETVEEFESYETEKYWNLVFRNAVITGMEFSKAW